MKESYRNKKHIRFHKFVEEQVVSVYLDRYEQNCFCVGAIISNSRRSNNDWFSSCACTTYYNTSTGKKGLRSLRTIEEILWQFTEDWLKMHDKLFLDIEGTDERRCNVYFHMMKRFLKKNNIEDTYFNVSNEYVIYGVVKLNKRKYFCKYNRMDSIIKFEVL